jgi:hypothetical protein
MTTSTHADAIDAEEYLWPDGPKLTDGEREIHLLLSATMLRAVLEGHHFSDERDLLRLDDLMKPLIKSEVRSHPKNEHDTRDMLDRELRKLNRLIVARLRSK